MGFKKVTSKEKNIRNLRSRPKSKSYRSLLTSAQKAVSAFAEVGQNYAIFAETHKDEDKKYQPEYLEKILSDEKDVRKAEAVTKGSKAVKAIRDAQARINELVMLARHDASKKFESDSIRTFETDVDFQIRSARSVQDMESAYELMKDEGGNRYLAFLMYAPSRLQELNHKALARIVRRDYDSQFVSDEVKELQNADLKLESTMSSFDMSLTNNAKQFLGHEMDLVYRTEPLAKFKDEFVQDGMRIALAPANEKSLTPSDDELKSGAVVATYGEDGPKFHSTVEPTPTESG